MTQDRNGLATQLLSFFRGRNDYVAVPNGTGFKPEHLPTGSLLPSRLEAEHFSGNRCLGFYVSDPGSRCLTSCADFDNKPDNPDPEWKDKTEATALCLQNLGLSPIVELSQSGSGAHVWLFFTEPVDAAVVRGFWAVISKKAGVVFKEIFPKQDMLDGKKLGNLVRYPLWNKSCFVDVENDWAPIDPHVALADVRKTSAAELRELAAKLGEPIGAAGPKPGASGSTNSAEPGLSPRVQSLLSKQGKLCRRWNGDTTGLTDKSRSGVVESIASKLVAAYIPTAEIEAAIRYWCQKNGYEKGLRDDWINRTVGHAYAFLQSKPSVEDVPKPTFELIDSATFAAAEFKLDWLIGGLMVRGQPAVVGGPKKSLKTSLLVDLALSLGTGAPFLGQFSVPASIRVAIMSGESGQATLQETARRIAKAKDISLASANVLWGFRLPQLADPKHLDALRETIEDRQIEALAIDPLYLSLLAGVDSGGPQASNLYQTGPLLLAVANTCLSAGCTPILAHHFKLTRANHYAEPELEDLAFSGIQEFARQWVLLGRREKYVPKSGSHRLWLSYGGSAGHSGLWSLDIEESVLGDDFSGRTWDLTLSGAAEAKRSEAADRDTAKRQKQADADRLDDDAIMAALDRLNLDGTGVSYNRVQLAANLSDGRMLRGVLRLKGGRLVEEVMVLADHGKGAKRPAKGLRRPDN